MAYKGQPFPSTVYDAKRAKVSDGKSVRVEVTGASGGTTIEAGKFYYLGGFLGAAMQSATLAENEKTEIILNIEPAEYETDQIKAADKNNMTAGADIFWNNVDGYFQLAGTSIYAGRVTVGADENSVVWFKMTERPYAADDVTTLSASVGDVDSLDTTASTVVTAINEIVDNVGDLADLDTDEDSSVVGAINELAGRVADKVDPVDNVENLSIGDATDLKAVATQLNLLLTKLTAVGLMGGE